MRHVFFYLPRPRAACLLALGLGTLLPLAGHAQATKPASKPAPKATTKPAAKPAARPAAKPAAAPAPKAAASPAPPAPAAPAPKPTPKSSGGDLEASLTDAFQTGDNVVSLGIGLGSRFTYGLGLLGGSSSSTPAFSLGLERGIVQAGPGYVGVGAMFGYQQSSYDFGLGNSRWRYHDAWIAVRGAYHYGFVPKLDTYAGISLGVRYLRSSYEGTSGTTSNDVYAAYGLYAGARYYFTPAIGGFAELGYDQAFLRVGLAAKF